MYISPQSRYYEFSVSREFPSLGQVIELTVSDAINAAFVIVVNLLKRMKL